MSGGRKETRVAKFFPRCPPSWGPNKRHLFLSRSFVPCSHSHSVITGEAALKFTNSHTNLQSVLLSVRLQPSRASWCGFFPPSHTDVDIPSLITILLSTDSLAGNSEFPSWCESRSSLGRGGENPPPLTAAGFTLPHTHLVPAAPAGANLSLARITLCCNYLLN